MLYLQTGATFALAVPLRAARTSRFTKDGTLDAEPAGVLRGLGPKMLVEVRTLAPRVAA